MRKKTQNEFDVDIAPFEKINGYSVIGKYTGNRNKILVMSKYGKCLAIAGNLLNGSKVSIMSAINKREYIRNVLKDIYKNEPYEYDNVMWNSASDYISVTCRYHGDFKKTIGDHRDYPRCPECNEFNRALDYDFKKHSEMFTIAANKVHDGGK